MCFCEREGERERVRESERARVNMLQVKGQQVHRSVVGGLR